LDYQKNPEILFHLKTLKQERKIQEKKLKLAYFKLEKHIKTSFFDP